MGGARMTADRDCHSCRWFAVYPVGSEELKMNDGTCSVHRRPTDSDWTCRYWEETE